MKISFLISDISLTRGGERATALLANALQASHQVHIVSLYNQNKTPFFYVDPRIEQHYINTISEPDISKIKSKYGEIKGLASLIKKLDSDIWIGVGTYCSSLLGVLSFRDKKSKYIAWEHSNYEAASLKWRIIRKTFFRFMDAVVCLTKSDEKSYLVHFPKVAVIPNILSFVTEKVTDLTQQTIISVGALEYEKGFDLLISSFKKIASQTDWNLKIIGSGSKGISLMRQIQEAGLTSRIHLTGNTADIKQVYLSSSIYVLPSRREGFGMVLIEAMECGVPCIAFDCDHGPRNIISNEENGLLVRPSGDIDKLGEAILSLINNLPLREKISKGGRLTSREYQSGHILRLWVSLFKQLQK